MNDRQRQFVKEYLVDLNAAAAARRAGYAPEVADRTGYRLLRINEIKQAIDEVLQNRSTRVQITADMVLQGLLAEATRTGEGSTHGARVAAWTAIAKHLGMFVDRHIVETSPGVLVLGGIDVSIALGQQEQPRPVLPPGGGPPAVP